MLHSRFTSSAQLLERAEECRTLAEQMIGEGPQQKMLKIAMEYDEMALRAKELEQGRPK